MERFGAPASPFDLLDRDLPQLFRRFFPDAGQGQARSWVPALDVFTRDDELHVRVELPGIDPSKDVDIEVTDGRLVIRGDRRHDETVSEQGWWRREISAGHFERTIVLPQGVDAAQVSARYDAGILDVTVPMPKPQSNKVRIETGNGSRPRTIEAETGTAEAGT